MLRPLLPDPEDTPLKSRRLAITPSLDRKELAQRLGELSETQIRYGWLEGYGDPTELEGAARQAALDLLLEPLSRMPALIQFLGSLDDSQWERLRGPGLKSSSGLTPDQRDALPDVLLENRVISPTAIPSHETLLALEDRPQLHGQAEPGVAPPRDHVLRVTRWMMLRDGRERAVDSDIYLWPTEVTVSLRLPEQRG